MHGEKLPFEMTEKALITIRSNSSQVSNLSDEAIATLKQELSYAIPGAYFVLQQKDYGDWDGRKRLVRKIPNKPAVSIKTGLVARTMMALYEGHKIRVQIEDERTKPLKTKNYEWNSDVFKLRDYQLNAVSESIEKTRGIIEVATGGGKTIIAAKLIQELGVSPFIFYVMTKELLYQAKERIESAIKDVEVGVIGDGQCEIKDINVVTIQTAARVYGGDIIKDIKKTEKTCDTFDDSAVASMKQEDLSHTEKKEKSEKIRDLIESCTGIYFDEAHHCPAKTAEKTIENSKKAYYLFGGTATPVRADNADLMIEGLFGRKTAIIDASFLIKKGHLMKPNIYFIELTTKPKRIANFAEDVRTNIVESKERNEHIVSIAQSLAEEGLSVLILVGRIDHGKELKKMIKGSEFIYGGSTTKKRTSVLQDLESKKRKIVVSSTIADEGLDIPTLNCVILGGGGKSPTKCKQRVGRAIRKTPDKEVSLIFDFMDIGKYTRKHSSSRKNMLKKESEFNIIDIKSFSDKRQDFISKTLF